MPTRLTIIVLTVLALVVLLLSRAEPAIVSRSRQAVTDAFTPVLGFVSQPVTAARGFMDDLGGILRVHQENKRLREENARLLAWQAAALQLEQTINRYNELLNVQIDPEIGFVTGRVVGEDGGPFVNTLIVNVGRKHGVKVGQAVVDSEGLIGHVVSTGNQASRILLLTDFNSRIPVIVEPSLQHAMLVGTNRSYPLLEYLADEAAVSPGNRIVTSGAEGKLPRGIPVGQVVKRNGEGWSVRPASRYDAADFVRILFFEFPRTIDPAEEDAETESPAMAVNDEGPAPDAILPVPQQVLADAPQPAATPADGQTTDGASTMPTSVQTPSNTPPVESEGLNVIDEDEGDRAGQG